MPGDLHLGPSNSSAGRYALETFKFQCRAICTWDLQIPVWGDLHSGPSNSSAVSPISRLKSCEEFAIECSLSVAILAQALLDVLHRATWWRLRPNEACNRICLVMKKCGRVSSRGKRVSTVHLGDHSVTLRELSCRTAVALSSLKAAACNSVHG